MPLMSIWMIMKFTSARPNDAVGHFGIFSDRNNGRFLAKRGDYAIYEQGTVRRIRALLRQTSFDIAPAGAFGIIKIV